MNIFKIKVIILLVALWAILPGCKKSNGAPPAMTVTIGDTTYQFASIANFHTVTDSIFAFNMKWRQSTDSSYIFLEFRGAFQLYASIDSHTRPVLFEYSNYGSVNYQAGGYAAEPGSIEGHMVVVVTAWDSTQHTMAGTFAGWAVPTSPNSNDSVAVSGNFNTTYIDN
jgi:hypothetical protein